MITRAKALITARRAAAEISAAAAEGGGGGGHAERTAERAACSVLGVDGKARPSARRQPCVTCGESDKRDAVKCSGCAATRHLMCFSPPWHEADTWTCEACASPPVPSERRAPVVGETLEVEVAPLLLLFYTWHATHVTGRRDARGRGDAVVVAALLLLLYRWWWWWWWW